MASESGTCLPVRATPSSWLMETASSRCCCTVASRKSPHQTRLKSPIISPPAEQRVTQSDPPCCPSAWRFAWSKQKVRKGWRVSHRVFISPFLCVDGLHQQCLQRWAKLRCPGRPERRGFYFGHPRAGLQREAVLLLVESHQETCPHPNK